jgi:hypothetical protein
MKTPVSIERIKRLVCVGTLITDDRIISILQQLKQSIGKLQTADLLNDSVARESASGAYSCSPTEGKLPGGCTGKGVAVQLETCSSSIVRDAEKGSHQYRRGIVKEMTERLLTKELASRCVRKTQNVMGPIPENDSVRSQLVSAVPLRQQKTVGEKLRATMQKFVLDRVTGSHEPGKSDGRRRDIYKGVFKRLLRELVRMCKKERTSKVVPLMVANMEETRTMRASRKHLDLIQRGWSASLYRRISQEYDKDFNKDEDVYKHQQKRKQSKEELLTENQIKSARAVQILTEIAAEVQCGAKLSRVFEILTKIAVGAQCKAEVHCVERCRARVCCVTVSKETFDVATAIRAQADGATACHAEIEDAVTPGAKFESAPSRIDRVDGVTAYSAGVIDTIVRSAEVNGTATEVRWTEHNQLAKTSTRVRSVAKTNAKSSNVVNTSAVVCIMAKASEKGHTIANDSAQNCVVTEMREKVHGGNKSHAETERTADWAAIDRRLMG